MTTTNKRKLLVPLYHAIVLCVLTLMFCSAIARAQDYIPQQAPDSTETGWPLKKWAAFSISSGIFAAILINSYFEWWQGNSARFGFYDPNKKHGSWFNERFILGMDKIGHAYSAYFFYRIQKAVLEWGGFTEEEALWWSAGFSYGVIMLIEVGDGFSDYSFDWRDVVMNTAGLAFGVARDKIPFMRHFNFKWCYIPEAWSFRISQQYHASSFWITADLVSMVKGNEGDPFIVQPAFGFSVTSGGREQEFMVGLDFDFNALLRSDNEYLEVFRNIQDPLHVPAPGIKFSTAYSPEYKPIILR